MVLVVWTLQFQPQGVQVTRLMYCLKKEPTGLFQMRNIYWVLVGFLTCSHVFILSLSFWNTLYLLYHLETSAQIGGWKFNFPPFQEIMTDQPIDRPTNASDGTEDFKRKFCLDLISLCSVCSRKLRDVLYRILLFRGVRNNFYLIFPIYAFGSPLHIYIKNIRTYRHTYGMKGQSNLQRLLRTLESKRMIEAVKFVESE